MCHEVTLWKILSAISHVTGGERSSLNWDLNPRPLAYHASTLTTVETWYIDRLSHTWIPSVTDTVDSKTRYIQNIKVQTFNYIIINWVYAADFDLIMNSSSSLAWLRGTDRCDDMPDIVHRGGAWNSRSVGKDSQVIETVQHGENDRGWLLDS